MRAIHTRARALTYVTNFRPVTRFRSMNVDWIAGHHLHGNTRRRTQQKRGCGMRAYTVTIIRMAITVAAAIHMLLPTYLRVSTGIHAAHPAHTHARVHPERENLPEYQETDSGALRRPVLNL